MATVETVKRTPMLQTEVAVLLDTFRRLSRRRAKANLLKLINKTHPADLALLFRQFTDIERISIFNLIRQTDRIGEFLSELDSTVIETLLQPLDAQEVAQLLEEVGSDDTADILNLLPEEKANAILETLRKEESEELEELMAYPEDTAGGIMSVDVFSLPESTQAGEAIKSIQSSEEAEMVFYLYITDEAKRLTGVVSLRDLVTVSPLTELKTIMVKDVVSVTPETDQEEVARQVSRYNLLAIPVIDSSGVLLGIVTVDDVVDVIREEATEDFLQMAGIGRDREILMKSTFENVKLRLPWLFASWIGGTIAVYIIGLFETVLQSIIALAAFIPVIVGMGGNVGTQSSTIIVRGFATGRVQLMQMGKVIWKEMRVGLVLGIFYGILLGAVASMKFIDAPPRLGLVVGLAICASMVIATSIGTLVPIVLRKLDVDPAIASGPFVTTSIDVLGILVYFLIAASLFSSI
ncbi:MAG: magnesium transporter [Candidatus Marinimicrobia bacterium]|jgi:magnesium transporter|nr:magnesium transporter [Candidatus Neomarinimicrobiota bacterium]MDP6455925.1 magnesium transporter [Candidatus Neomarinimicrobiota bacterium]MDP6592989.1 magnesium transporter [Candidatus Neomarinimicrobiota bacterium]MDP6835925.1 magnesium transporter [Candidatus Neomarinimicrobiota bacterium]MDP6967430.1 magnesium transporter [Candidatus Neomarinimicrobiota bacterium]|tara:strand:- start:23071 stop:24465 length:1395 start_codon:yes stop_codon:yes gene_type:complete